ncbi:hypothetical protein B0A49_13160 [Cryomyces minteri]|uniref:Uncharacterized protein n=1 Tax=Cryomyces minteri TaxID=331657 RepID=A0A4U0WQC2_9PEZI|nr:hypothetical protein B0A49_13160 [Cryomyces minteri]
MGVFAEHAYRQSWHALQSDQASQSILSSKQINQGRLAEILKQIKAEDAPCLDLIDIKSAQDIASATQELRQQLNNVKIEMVNALRQQNNDMTHQLQNVYREARQNIRKADANNQALMTDLIGMHQIEVQRSSKKTTKMERAWRAALFAKEHELKEKAGALQGLKQAKINERLAKKEATATGAA